MDIITNSNGLWHIAERIFMHFDYESILKCENVNENWRQIVNATNSPKTSLVLKKPWFWVRAQYKNYEQVGLLTVDHQMNLIRMIRKNPEKLIFHCLKIVFE